MDLDTAYALWRKHFGQNFYSFTIFSGLEAGSEQWREAYGHFVDFAGGLYAALYPDDPDKVDEMVSTLELMGDAVIYVEGIE